MDGEATIRPRASGDAQTDTQAAAAFEALAARIAAKYVDARNSARHAGGGGPLAALPAVADLAELYQRSLEACFECQPLTPVAARAYVCLALDIIRGLADPDGLAIEEVDRENAVALLDGVTDWITSLECESFAVQFHGAADPASRGGPGATPGPLTIGAVNH